MNSPITSVFKGTRIIISKSVSANYSFDNETETINVDASVGPITITLPLISNNIGRLLTVRKIDSSVNVVTIVTIGPDLYQGSTTAILSTQYEVLSLDNNGTQWLTSSGGGETANGTVVPTSGTWYAGDRVLNSILIPGGITGWGCVASGTQGTYDQTRTATTNGTTAVTLSGVDARFRVGDFITINGTSVTITTFDTNTYVNMTVSSVIAAGSGLAITFNNATFAPLGTVTGSASDSTASPGAATQNTLTGRVAIAAGANSVIVTNSYCTTISRVYPVLQTIDATLTSVPVCVPANGSFTIYGNLNATAACNVGWEIR